MQAYKELLAHAEQQLEKAAQELSSIRILLDVPVGESTIDAVVDLRARAVLADRKVASLWELIDKVYAKAQTELQRAEMPNDMATLLGRGSLTSPPVSPPKLSR